MTNKLEASGQDTSRRYAKVILTFHIYDAETVALADAGDLPPCTIEARDAALRTLRDYNEAVNALPIHCESEHEESKPSPRERLLHYANRRRAKDRSIQEHRLYAIAVDLAGELLDLRLQLRSQTKRNSNDGLAKRASARILDETPIHGARILRGESKVCGGGRRDRRQLRRRPQ